MNITAGGSTPAIIRPSTASVSATLIQKRSGRRSARSASLSVTRAHGLDVARTDERQRGQTARLAPAEPPASSRSANASPIDLHRHERAIQLATGT